MKKTAMIEVEASGLELMLHLEKLVKAYKSAMKDGWQPGQDLPAILMAVIAEGPGLVSNLAQLKPDAEEDLVALIAGINIGAYGIVAAVRS